MAEIIRHNWGELHKHVFCDFISKLNINKIRFLLLRNYEQLPEKNTSKDIDILIDPKSFNKAKRLLLDIFKYYKLQNYYVVKFERSNCWYGIDVDRDFFIHIDLICGYFNKGFEIIDFDTLYNNTVQYKEFRVLNSEYHAVMLILYKLIACKELKNKYRCEIIHIFNSKPQVIQDLLSQILGNNLSDKIVSILKKSDFNGLISISNKISSAAKIRTFLSAPIRTIFYIVSFYAEKFHRIILCPQKYQRLIAVEAPDGTGKTTFIEHLQTQIAKIFVCEINKSTIYHFRPEILPNLGAVGEKIQVMKQDTDFTNPHRAKPANKLSSCFRMFYYWIDYVIGVPLIVRNNARQDRFSIFDRYIYDFLVDPRRSRINLPYWLRRWFTKLVKQPKIVFVLDAPAEVIYKRKQELSLDEISRQLIEFRKLSSLGKCYYRLDASQKPEEIANDAIKIILNNFTNKL